MTTLTKEYVDKRLTTMDKRFDAVDKRFDSVETTIEDEIHTLATMVAKGFDDIAKRLDVRDRVETLENRMSERVWVFLNRAQAV